jgi:hypothetical protein
MSINKQRDRKCATCRHYQPSPLWRKGWCRNPLLFDPTTNHLVESESLSCARAFIDYWEPRAASDKAQMGPSVSGRPIDPGAATRPRVAPSIPLNPAGPGGTPLRATPPIRAATAEALTPPRDKPPLALVRPDATTPLDPAPLDVPDADAPAAALASEDPPPVLTVGAGGATIRIQGVAEPPAEPRPATDATRTRLVLALGIVLSLVVLFFVPQIRAGLDRLAATPTPRTVPPTATMIPLFVPPLPTETPVPPTPAPPPPLPPLVLAPGGYAQVVNTDGAALRIRLEPNTRGRILARVPEGSRLQIHDGPINDGQRNWWRITGFDQKGTLGWCVEEFLRPVP